MVSYATPLKVIHYGGSITQTLGGEIKSSGRPKAKGLHQEDADFVYEYDRRGGLKSKRPKSNLEKHAYWYKNNVKFVKGTGAK